MLTNSKQKAQSYLKKIGPFLHKLAALTAILKSRLNIKKYSFKSKALFTYLITSALIVTAAAFYTGSVTYTASTRELINPHQDEEKAELKEFVIVPQPEMYLNTLVLGLDPSGLGDAIIVISYNLYTYQVIITSIPRDTYVENQPWAEEGHGGSHLCFANYVGMGPAHDNYHNGAAYTAYWIEILFGLPIHEYIVVTDQSLIELVDLVGGIEIDVDPAFSGKLPTGLQKLSGEQVVTYARFRGAGKDPRIPEPGSDSDDGDRIRRIQRLIKTAFSQVRAMRLNEILAIARQVPEMVHTSYSLFDLTALAPDLYKAKLNDLVTIVIPGEMVEVFEAGSGENTYYFYADYEKTAALFESYGLK